MKLRYVVLVAILVVLFSVFNLNISDEFRSTGADIVVPPPQTSLSNASRKVDFPRNLYEAMLRAKYAESYGWYGLFQTNVEHEKTRVITFKLNNLNPSHASITGLLAKALPLIEAAGFTHEAMLNALNLYGRGNPRPLDDMLESSTFISKNPPGTLYLRGQIAEEAMDWERALMHYKAAAELKPRAMRYLNSTSMMATRLGLNRMAEKYLLDEIKGYMRTSGASHPSTLLARINLAVLYANQNRNNEAKEHYLHVIEELDKMQSRHRNYLPLILNSLIRLSTHLGDTERTESLKTFNASRAQR